MVSLLLMAVATVPIGQVSPDKLGGPKKEAPAEHKVVYIGRGGEESAAHRASLELSLTATGQIVGDGKYVADDEMLRKLISDYCKGYEKVSIVIAVQEPEKTSIRTMARAVDRLKKQVPEKTAATFYVADAD